MENTKQITVKEAIKCIKITHEKARKLVKDNKDFNIQTPTGYIYLVGGILSKLENHEHYISINNKWVKV